MALGLVHLKRRLGQHLALARPGGPVHINLRVTEDHLFGLRLGGVDQHQRGLVAAAVADGVETAVLRVEELRADARAEVGGDQR
ncbi:MAG: hypothetical protein ACK559_26925, partial [bacterium]